MTSRKHCLHPTRIGVIGSGFVSKGFVMALDTQDDMAITRILTRTRIEERTDFPKQNDLPPKKESSYNVSKFR